MKILVLGVNGMLGHVLFSQASKYGQVIGTSRRKSRFKDVYENFDSDNIENFKSLINDNKPDFVLNCVGIIKQLKESKDPLISIKVNALFPHEIAAACRESGAKLIHFSTDCVFKGDRGNYDDFDISDATDLYGKTKALGEVDDNHSVTVRTSIIGHELEGYNSLVDWFLHQRDSCKGFSHAVYSGFPTIVISQIIFEVLIPKMKRGFSGVFNVSSNPITKLELLKLIAVVYNKQINIIPDEHLRIDRSLNSLRFRSLTGFEPETWQTMIEKMRDHFITSNLYDLKKEYYLEDL